MMKREARKVLELVRGLTAMSPKQLAAVEHLLPPGTAEAVGIAARLPRSNQGRKRQEALVAKMLRGQLNDAAAEKLEAAVALAAENSGSYEDNDVAALLAAWQEGLLGEDPAVIAEVYGYPNDWAPDHQQLRTLVRQCQQALEEESRPALEGGAPQGALAAQAESTSGPGSESGSGNESGSGSGSEAEVEVQGEGQDAELAAVLEEARARSGGGGGGSGSGGGGGRRGRKAEPRSRPLLRSLGRLLRPLAKRVVQEGMLEGLEG